MGVDDRLAISVTNAKGLTKRWGAGEPDAVDIPGDLTFSTSMPGGFKDLSTTLLRRIDIDYPDLGLFDTVRVYGPGNRTAWEGRAAQFPRSHGDGFQIVPGAVGWSAHLNDDPSFREIYIDRDLTKWGGSSVQRRLNLTASSSTPVDPDTIPDASTGQPSLRTSVSGVWTSPKPLCEAWYSAAGISIGSLFYAWKRDASQINSADANWSWTAFVATDDVVSTSDTTGQLRAAGPSTGTLSATAAGRTFALLQHYYGAAGGAAGAEYALYWTCLAVYGRHGLTKQGTDSATSAKGFYASDVIRDIVTRAAPSLTVGTIDATTFVIPHLVFDTPTTAENAIQFVNAYHGFDWGVYDNRTFFYQASDPDRLTWQARLSTGARLDLEGETAEQVFNGVFVTYTDASGKQKTVGPPGATADATSSALADTSSTNPVNSHSITRRWGMLNISQTTTLAGATQLGAIWLAQHGAPQRRGTLTLTGTVTHPTEGEVPVWRVRAGDYVSISDHPADVPRRIIETRYTHGSRQITLNLDNTPYVLDALLTRFGAGLVGVL